jgi:sugar lactone lactonase YvrE
MKFRYIFKIVTLSLICASNAFSQEIQQGSPQGMQAARDLRAQNVFAQTCTIPPSISGARPGTGELDTGPKTYHVSGIPGVIAEGREWQLIWEGEGHNADGIVGLSDGVLIAQNSKGSILKVGFDGVESYPYPDTRTGGSLSMNVMGELFVVERGLYPSVTMVSPIRRELANIYNGEPLHCLGGVINDLTADNRGGVYFTHGGLYYSAPDGTITRYGEGLRTNGIILSPDEQVLYVTNQEYLVAFDVQPDGSLVNQRIHAELPSSSGDGLAIDSMGRIYVSSFQAGVHVIAANGLVMGTISTPRNVIAAAFGGPDKHTLYVVGTTTKDGYSVELLAIDMLAQGYTGRAK